MPNDISSTPLNERGQVVPAVFERAADDYLVRSEHGDVRYTRADVDNQTAARVVRVFRYRYV
jgi:hypothetical protein